jgi:peptidoglycan DL-endopeptidase CwlO
VERLTAAGRSAGQSPHRPHSPGRMRIRGSWRRAGAVLSTTAVAGLMLSTGVASAAPGRPQPSLSDLVAQAKVLSNQINTLSEQYDGLQIQLSQARTQAKLAARTYTQDARRLGLGRLTIGRLAAQSYITGSLDGTLQMLTSNSPQAVLNRAAILQQLQHQNGARISQLASAEAAALRAQQTAQQQAARVGHLVTAMAAKKDTIQQKINVLNSAAFAQAMTIFQQTGNYPNIDIPTGNSIGAQALRFALRERGVPYVWGGASPGGFDCSGLVMWAYAQVGISLPHYTGAQWNMGIHVGRGGLMPGDLLFFYSDLGHVGLYIGNGLMVDAPDFGQVVKVEPVMWSVFVGAVRIVG